MAGIKIVDYATDRKTKADAAVAKALTDLTDAQKELADAQKDQNAAVKALGDLELEMSSLREQLKGITVPADAQPLIDQLIADLIKLPSTRKGAADAESKVFLKQHGIDRVQARLSACMAIQASADAAMKAADDGEKARQDLRDAITKAPLATLKATATATIASAVFTDARNRLRGGHIPNTLFDRAMHRGDEASATTDAAGVNAQWAEDVFNEDVDTTQGLDGAVVKARAAFQRSQDAFRTYVVTAKDRYDHAVAVLKPMKDAPLPSATELAAINDATKQTDRDAALQKEEALADAQAAYDSAQASVDKATWEALRQNPDADPATDAGVTNAVAFRDGAIATALTQARNDFQNQQPILDSWQAAVPDATWRLVSDFYSAQSTLSELANLDPAALRSQMDNDETPYATALSNQAENERAMYILADVVRDQADRRDNASRSAAATAASAVRGSS